MPDDASSSGTVEPRRFVWPPRHDAGDAADAGAEPVAHVEADSATEELSGDLDRAPDEPSGPPSQVNADAGSLPERRRQSAGVSQASRARGWREVIHEVERVWLGQVTPPLGVRIADAGWSPDQSGDYCHRCGLTIGQGRSGCEACGKRRIGCERIVRLGEFHGLLREVVHEVKFTCWRRLGTQIGGMLGELLKAELEAAGVDLGTVVLVPIPTSFRRRMRRGIDHPLVIARGVAGTSCVPIVCALTRRHRPMQQSLPASQRAANLVGAIRLKRWAAERLMGRHVVLVDDVSTTGATLRVASRAIREGVREAAEAVGDGVDPGGVRRDVRVWAAVLAVTREEGRPSRPGSAGTAAAG